MWQWQCGSLLMELTGHALSPQSTSRQANEADLRSALNHLQKKNRKCWEKHLENRAREEEEEEKGKEEEREVFCRDFKKNSRDRKRPVRRLQCLRECVCVCPLSSWCSTSGMNNASWWRTMCRRTSGSWSLIFQSVCVSCFWWCFRCGTGGKKIMLLLFQHQHHSCRCCSTNNRK